MGGGGGGYGWERGWRRLWEAVEEEEVRGKKNVRVQMWMWTERLPADGFLD